MPVAPRGFRGESITQAAELDFTDFVVLYKSFSLRARNDLRELFKTLAVTRKSLSDSSLDDPGLSPSSPPTSPAQRPPPLAKPSLGLLTRNTSLDLLVFRNNCHKKKIFDAIAAASIVTNCAGLDSSKSQVSREGFSFDLSLCLSLSFSSLPHTSLITDTSYSSLHHLIYPCYSSSSLSLSQSHPHVPSSLLFFLSSLFLTYTYRLLPLPYLTFPCSYSSIPFTHYLNYVSHSLPFTYRCLTPPLPPVA